MFSRGSHSAGRHARSDRSRQAPRAVPARGAGGHPGHQPTSTAAAGAGAAGGGAASGTPAAGGTDPGAAGGAGPYDISQAPEIARLNLGSLQIPTVAGVEVRAQANQDGKVQQLFLVDGDSTLQVGAFAAPRTESIWDEVREEIRESLFNDGVAAQELPGPYGTELRARVRTKDGIKDLRFVGVSGPRWLVRAVFQGPAAVDENRASRLTACLQGLVVDRGEEARPTREPLPLRLPPEMAARMQARQEQAGGRPPGSAPPAAQAGGAQPFGSPPPGTGASAPGARRRPSPRPRRSGPPAGPAGGPAVPGG